MVAFTGYSREVNTKHIFDTVGHLIYKSALGEIKGGQTVLHKLGLIILFSVHMKILHTYITHFFPVMQGELLYYPARRSHCTVVVFKMDTAGLYCNNIPVHDFVYHAVCF